jgi:hypothetical protein
MKYSMFVNTFKNLYKVNKKIILTLIITAVSLSATFSQEGKITLGVDYATNTTQEIYAYDLYYPYGYYGQSYKFEPRVGYFISDKIEIGFGFKAGNNEETRTLLSYNQSGGDNYEYENTSNYDYKVFSPYVKYYINNLFVSARFSIENRVDNQNYNYPIWGVDTNGVNNVVGLDHYDYSTKTIRKSSVLSIGYVLAYNSKLFFEPSISVRKDFGEVNSKSDNDFFADEDTSTESISPINNATHFSLNIAVGLRLGK